MIKKVMVMDSLSLGSESKALHDEKVEATVYMMSIKDNERRIKHR